MIIQLIKQIRYNLIYDSIDLPRPSDTTLDTLSKLEGWTLKVFLIILSSDCNPTSAMNNSSITKKLWSFLLIQFGGYRN